MADKTKKQLLIELKEKIKKDYTHFTFLGEDYYLVDKNDYMFHIYKVYINEKGNEVIAEMYYNLRESDYYVKRNLSEVKFNHTNVDCIIPRKIVDRSGEEVIQFFDFIETEHNKGMYQTLTKSVGSLGLEKVNMPSRAMIRLIQEYNRLELLYKNGIDISNPDVIYLAHNNRKETKPYKILGLTKASYKVFKQYFQDDFVKDVVNGTNTYVGKNGEYILRRIRSLDEYATGAGKSLTNQLVEFKNFIDYLKELDEEYGLDRARRFNNSDLSFRQYFGYTGGRWGRRTVFEISQDYGLDLKRLVRYLYYECDVSQALEWNDALRFYDDYTRMSREVGNNNYDRYPKFLRTYHDIVARNHEVALNQEEEKLFTSSVDSYKGYDENELGKYIVITPKTPKDLVEEGNSLSHCIGSYTKKVMKRSTQLVFLRLKKEKDVPLVSVEIRDGKLVQARGKYNRKPTADEIKALNTFCRRHKITSQYLTKEDELVEQ